MPQMERIEPKPRLSIRCVDGQLVIIDAKAKIIFSDPRLTDERAAEVKQAITAGEP